MAKMPAFQFYPGDWMQDTRVLSLAAKGAWIDLLCAMWHSQNRGVLTYSWVGYSRLIGATAEQAKAAIAELIDARICDSVTERNGDVTLSCRRMVREEKDRICGRIRVKRHRNANVTPRCNGDGNANVTVPSSSSSSSSSSCTIVHSDERTRDDGDSLDGEIRAFVGGHSHLQWDTKMHSAMRRLVEGAGWERAKDLIQRGIAGGNSFPVSWALKVFAADQAKAQIATMGQDDPKELARKAVERFEAKRCSKVK